MGGGSIRIVVQRTGADALIACEGEIDLSTADEFEEAFRALINVTPSRLDIDLSNVPFMDSTGLHILTRIAKTCAEMNITATIHPSEPITKLLRVTGLDAALPIAPPDGRRDGSQ